MNRHAEWAIRQVILNSMNPYYKGNPFDMVALFHTMNWLKGAPEYREQHIEEIDIPEDDGPTIKEVWDEEVRKTKEHCQRKNLKQQKAIAEFMTKETKNPLMKFIQWFGTSTAGDIDFVMDKLNLKK